MQLTPGRGSGPLQSSTRVRISGIPGAKTFGIEPCRAQPIDKIDKPAWGASNRFSRGKAPCESSPRRATRCSECVARGRPYWSDSSGWWRLM